MDQSIRLRRPDEMLPEECPQMNIAFMTGSPHAIPLDMGNRRFMVVEAEIDIASDDKQCDVKVGVEVR